MMKAISYHSYQDLLPVFETAYTKNPYDYVKSYHYGSLLLSAGKGELAESVWRGRLTEFQNFGVLWLMQGFYNLGEAYRLQGKYDEALQYIEASIQMMPERPHLLFGLVEIYQDLDTQPERALELTTHVFSRIKEPRFSWLYQRVLWGLALSRHALALANMGRLDEADIFIQRAFDEGDEKYRPMYAEYHHIAGQVRQKQGRMDEAKSYYEQAISIDRDGAIAREAQARLDALT